MMAAAALVTRLVPAIMPFTMMMPTRMVFSVMAATAFITLLMPTIKSFTKMVPTFMASTMMVFMMIAACVRIIFQRSSREGLGSLVCRSPDTCIELDARVCQCHLRSHTDPATDQGVDFRGLKETSQSAVPAAVCVDNLFSHNAPVFHIIELELLGMTEMLEDFSVFICDRNSHSNASFLHNVDLDFNRRILTATACDQQPFPVYQRVSHFSPGVFIDGCDGCTGNVHPDCACFLCQAFAVHKPQCFVLVDSHENSPGF